MNMTLSENTQAILLLTAPLIAGRGESSSEILTLREYKQLTRILRDRQRQPADLLSPHAGELHRECQAFLDNDRLERLLGRGFLLSQAIERWHARAIWVISRADGAYPRRLKARLGEEAPPVLYGCGDAEALDAGGFAVVGSRQVDDAIAQYAESIGRLAAHAGCTLVSGGARGIDRAAMRGALEAGGRVVGVLADSLERAALAREHRDVLMNRQLVLVSPYDPAAGFNVGHAMQRNKLIYALSDAALVVSSDYQKGGTWTGAVEQLERLRFVPIYVRSNGETQKGLESLREKGALRWPDPATPEAFLQTLTACTPADNRASRQACLLFDVLGEADDRAHHKQSRHSASAVPEHTANTMDSPSPAEELFSKVRELLTRMNTTKTDTEVAEEMRVSKGQAREWLNRLVHEGLMERLSKPIRYRPLSPLRPLFDKGKKK